MAELVAGFWEAMDKEDGAFLWGARRRKRFDVVNADFRIGALYPDRAVVVVRVVLSGMGAGFGCHVERSDGELFPGAIRRRGRLIYHCP